MTTSDDLDLYAKYGAALWDISDTPIATILKCRNCKYCIMTEVVDGEEVYGCNRFGMPIDYYYSACSFGERKPEDT